MVSPSFPWPASAASRASTTAEVAGLKLAGVEVDRAGVDTDDEDCIEEDDDDEEEEDEVGGGGTRSHIVSAGVEIWRQSFQYFLLRDIRALASRARLYMGAAGA